MRRSVQVKSYLDLSLSLRSVRRLKVEKSLLQSVAFFPPNGISSSFFEKSSEEASSIFRLRAYLVTRKQKNEESEPELHLVLNERAKGEKERKTKKGEEGYFALSLLSILSRGRREGAYSIVY